MQEREIATEYDKPWRRGIGLDHVAELGISVLSPAGGWRPTQRSEYMAEFAVFISVAALVDLGRQLKYL